MKVAIVCDWLVTYAGAEKVLEQILNVFPDADLFALVDFIPEGQRDFIKNKKVTTTFIQNMPKAKPSIETICPSCLLLLNSWMYLPMTWSFPVPTV